MKKLTLTLLATLLSFNALAGTGTGKILGIIPYSYGGQELLFIKVEITSSNTPVCNFTQRLVMGSNNNLHFKATQAMALAAMLAGTNVIIKGTENCDVWDNSETFSSMCVGDIPC